MSSKIEIEKVCEFCGTVFTAQKTTTRYCSHKCNSRAYKANKRQQKVQEVRKVAESVVRFKPLKEVKDKEYLSVSEAATLLGMCKQSIYNLAYSGKLRATKLSSRMTIISRVDIEEMLSNQEVYKPRPNIEREPITDFYTVAEITERYNIQYRRLYDIVRENSIPKVLDRGKVYYSKQHVDSYFESKESEQQQDITEWYTVQEAMEANSMTLNAVYSFVSENNIPKMRKGKTVYYSKKHFDIAKGKLQPDEPEYYSVQEAMEKFGLTRDALYHYVKYHKIPKIKSGKYIKISKPDLDRLFQQPTLFT